MPTLTLRDIASSIDGEAKGNVDFTISHLSEAQRCNNNQICFIKDESFISKLSEDAGAVILSPEIAKKVKSNQIQIKLLKNSDHRLSEPFDLKVINESITSAIKRN